MATCNRCGAETQLYDTGCPICIACSSPVPRNPAENIGLTDIDLTDNDAPPRLV
jgi:hypothetical protein